MSRPIRFDGADNDLMLFSTPSWSRYAVGIRHTLSVCKRTGEITCDCESALYGKLRGHAMNPFIGCKHAQALAKTFRRILNENITVALAA